MEYNNLAYNSFNHKFKIPLRFKGKDLNNFKNNDKLVKHLKENILKDIQNKKTLLITGDTGTGKTHLAIAIVKHLIQEARLKNLSLRKIEYISSSEITRQIKKNMYNKEVDKYKEYQNTSLLVIDDLCSFDNTDYSKNILHSLISDRYDNNLMTIFTANFDLKQIASYFDSRTVSRMSEGEIIYLKGGDWRVEKC